MKHLILSVLAICLVSACGTDPDARASGIASNEHSPRALSEEQNAKYQRSCALCHGVAGTGAPAPQDANAWQARNAQGLATLIDHTINGHGGMPPMGMCMDCDQDDFVAFIEFMSGLECEE